MATRSRLGTCIFIASLLQGCASLPFFGKEEDDDVTFEHDAKKKSASDDEATPAARGKTKPRASEEQELKLAKLWARVDEMEEEQFRMKEKVRLLEKGLTLGLVPEELKKGERKAKAAKHEEIPEKHDRREKHERHEDKKEPDLTKVLEPAVKDEPGPDGPSEKPVEGAKDGDLSKEETERYQKMLADAQEQFRSGRYARAAVEFSAIDKQFGTRLNSGIHLYFLAQCWASLKEYGTARTHYVEFMKKYPASPWQPRAKVELARVEINLGMRETATERLSRVVQEHPYEDAAELARMELERLKKTL